jgi:predicted RNase H-like nuclease (RuvC/YqgF family)
MSSQRSSLSALQSANTALRFEIANLKAEREELVAEKKSSDLQQEHDEEVQALQGTLVRTKQELEAAKRELRKSKRAAAGETFSLCSSLSSDSRTGVPELKIISPDGKVIPYANTSSSTCFFPPQLLSLTRPPRYRFLERRS